jgi:hypothetical protein
MTRESRKVQRFCCSVSLQILEQYRQVGRNGLKPFGTRVRHNGGALPSAFTYVSLDIDLLNVTDEGGAGCDRIGQSSLGFRAPVWAGIHPHSTDMLMKLRAFALLLEQTS